MQRDEVTLIDSILRDIAQKLSSAVEDLNLARRLLAGHRGSGPGSPSSEAQPAGLTDEGRFVARWQGRECQLGNTVSFRLFRCLAAARNRYVPHLELLEDVWEGEERTPSAIRSAIGELRSRLVSGGLKEVADAIDGAIPGHYGLLLERSRPPRDSDRFPTAIRPASDSPDR